MSIVSVLFTIAAWHPKIMTSITDPNMSDRFTSTLEEIHNKQLKTYGEIIDSTTELCQAHKHFVKSALGIPASLHLDLNCLWL